jgi:hypothetical protein
MENASSQEITNEELFSRLVRLSDAIQRLADAQIEHGKKLDQLSAAVSDLTEDVSRIVESLPDN